MQGWLLGAYLEIIGIKVLGYLILRDLRAESGNITCYLVCFLGFLFPFLLAWTILGTIWYVQAVNSACVLPTQLPKEEEPWLIVMVLITFYVMLALFVVVMVSTAIKLAVWRRRRGEGVRPLVNVNDPDDEEERPLNPSELRLLDSFAQKFRPNSDTPTCTICYEDFKVLHM